MIKSSEWLAFMLLKKYPFAKWKRLATNCYMFDHIILVVEYGKAPQAFAKRVVKTNITRTRTDFEDDFSEKVFLYL